MKTVSKAQRLKKLAQFGLMPKELPPPFHSDDLSKHRNKILNFLSAVDPNKFFYSEPDFYPISRVGIKRRNLSIVNPINHLYISKEISDNWVEIRNFMRTSKASAHQIEFSNKINESINEINFDVLEEKFIGIMSEYETLLKTDISRFYPTIYTHSIPWAMLGKVHAKSLHSSRRLAGQLSDTLDRLIRNSQKQQTIGIPIGPETSRIISEIIGCGIDHVFEKKNKKGIKFIRNVDDILV